MFDHGSFTVEYMDASSGSVPEELATETEAELLAPSPAGAPTSPHTKDGPESPQLGSPQQVSPDRLDADHDDAPLCLRSMDSIIGQAEAPGLAARNLEHGDLFVVNADEPSSLEEAERQGCWRAAMEEELRAIEDNNTWTLTELPLGRHAIGLKWVFKIKCDEQGDVI
jgi:hypothetical protein